MLSKIVGGWRIAGVHSYASGFPLSVSPGYGLPLFGGDNRLTVLDDTGWRAPTQGELVQPAGRSAGGTPRSSTPTPVDTISQLQGYKAGVLRAEFGNAEVRNPNERGPWFLNENIAVARTFNLQKTRVELRFEAFNLLNRTIWGAPDSTITSANFGLVTGLANSPRQMQLGVRFEF